MLLHRAFLSLFFADAVVQIDQIAEKKFKQLLVK